MMVQFTVPGHPVPAPRMTRKSLWKRRSMEYFAWKGRIQHALRQAAGRVEPRPGPWRVLIRVYVSGRGDSDNYAKGILDALSGRVRLGKGATAIGEGLWLDDSQVVDVRVIKERVSRGEERTEIEAEWLGEAKEEARRG